MRSIYVLELSLLQYRDRKEIGHALTRQQKEALNRFLNEYSESLLHIAAITEHGPQAPCSSSESVQYRRVEISGGESGAGGDVSIADQGVHHRQLPGLPGVIELKAWDPLSVGQGGGLSQFLELGER